MGAYTDSYTTFDQEGQDTLFSLGYKELFTNFTAKALMFLESEVLRNTIKLLSSKVDIQSSVSSLPTIVEYVPTVAASTNALCQLLPVANINAKSTLSLASLVEFGRLLFVYAARIFSQSSAKLTADSINILTSKAIFKALLELSTRLNGTLLEFVKPISSESSVLANSIRIKHGFVDIVSKADAWGEVRNTGPVNLEFTLDITPKSNILLTLVSAHPVTYLSNELYQPVDYYMVNSHRVCSISFDKRAFVYLPTHSSFKFSHDINKGTVGEVFIDGSIAFIDANLAKDHWLLIKSIVAESSLEFLDWIVNLGPSLIVNAISNVSIDGIEIRGLYADWAIQSIVDVAMPRIRYRGDTHINAISNVKDIKTSMWKEGRPAIRVTTLYQDILRNPRGQIVILEDPTI